MNGLKIARPPPTEESKGGCAGLDTLTPDRVFKQEGTFPLCLSVSTKGMPLSRACGPPKNSNIKRADIGTLFGMVGGDLKNNCVLFCDVIKDGITK